jgi:hypothetical protein
MSATTEAKTKTGAELLTVLGEQELPLAEALKVIGEPTLTRAWAAGEIEFGHTKYVVSGSPGFSPGEDPLHATQRLGPTLIIEKGLEWSGEKTRFLGRFKDVVRDARMPEVDFYQYYRQEVCTDRRKDTWVWLGEGENPGRREVRWVRVECSKEQAEKQFVWLVRLTDKGLSKLLGD